MVTRCCSLLLVTLLLAACTTPPVDGVPEGFARYGDKPELQAVDARRVVYRVREVDNKPEAELSFWQVALKERLRKGGYVLVSDGAIAAGARAGYFVETVTTRGALDYNYLVAIFVQGSRITVIEAAGETKAYGAKREQIFAALRRDASTPDTGAAR